MTTFDHPKPDLKQLRMLLLEAFRWAVAQPGEELKTHALSLAEFAVRDLDEEPLTRGERFEDFAGPRAFRLLEGCGNGRFAFSDPDCEARYEFVKDMLEKWCGIKRAGWRGLDPHPTSH